MKKLSLVFALIFISASFAFAQRSISGVVADEKGEPLYGASVLVTGTAVGTTTDFDGKYAINVPASATSLEISYTGFTTQTVPLGVSNIVDVTLAEGIQISEAVVTALGISREKKSLGYSTQVVDGDLLAESNETNFINALAGKVSGVQINGGTGNMGGSSRILIRGANSITGGNEPLIVVDGVPIDNSNFTSTNQATGRGGYDYGNAAQDINSEDIESVNILKGGAAALYGSRASNGVILITTKSGKSKKKGFGISVNSGLTIGTVTQLPNYQNEYGGGSGVGFDTLWANANPSAFFDGNGNNSIDQGEADYWDATSGGYALIPDYGTDESWGSKLDQGTMVRHWDSWDEWDTDNYLTPREWASNPNNIKEFYETAYTYDNSIAFSGSNDAGNFRVSLGNVNQKYIYPGSQLKKNTIGFSGGYNLTEKLRATVGGNFVNTQAKGRPGTGYDGNNVSQQFNQWGQRQWNMDHMRNYINPNGTNRTWNRNAWNDETPHYTDNPFWTMYKNYEEDSRNRIFGNVALSYKILPSLSVQGRLSSDSYTDRREERIAVYSQNIPFYEEGVREVSEINKEVIFNYNPKLNTDQWNFSALVGANRRDAKYGRNVERTVGGLNATDYYNIDNSSGNPSVDDYANQKRVNSVFAQATFGYQNFLYLDVTGRNDWSSTLPAENNSYFYPSASLSYVFSEHVNASFLSFAKLRLGWSQVGNDTDPYRLKTYSYLPGFRTSDTDRVTKSFNGNPLVYVSGTKLNPELKPETTTSTEFGLDFKFFKNRLGLEATYYINNTTNQIISLKSSPTIGFSSILLNAGKMENKGLELQLTGTPIHRKMFVWDITFNVAKNTNKVVELYKPENGDEITNLTINTAPFAVSVNATVGEKYGAIKGYNFVYDDNGNKLVGSNGRYVKSDNIEVIGNALADWTGGFYNTFAYGPISLGFLVDFQIGGDIFSTTNMWGKYSGLLQETVDNNIREDGIVVEGVYAPGTIIDGEDVSGQKNETNISARSHFFGNQGYVINAADVYDASYAKLREVQLGYKLPSKLISRIGIQDFTISAVGRNLAYLFKNAPNIDPEAAVSTGNFQGVEGAQLPAVRSIGLNLSLKF